MTKKYVWKLGESIADIRFGDLLSTVEQKYKIKLQIDTSDDLDSETSRYQVVGEDLSIWVSNGHIDSITCDANCYVGQCNVIGEKFDDIRLLFGIDDFCLEDEYEIGVWHETFSSINASALVFCENGIVTSLSVGE